MYKVGLYMEVIHIECHGGDYACWLLGWDYAQGWIIHGGYTHRVPWRGLCMWGAMHWVGGRVLSTRGDYTQRLYTMWHGEDYTQGGCYPQFTETGQIFI